MGLATQQRDTVSSLAASDPMMAVELARAISDPWFRCQALSIAALHLPDAGARSRALSDAFASANQLTEPNRVVTVSAWPLKVMLLTGYSDEAAREVARLLSVIAEEPSPVRRADALRYVLGAVTDAPLSLARSVAESFAGACLTRLKNGHRNDKGESHLELCLPALDRIDSELTGAVIPRLSPTRAARAMRAIEEQRGVPLRLLLSWPNMDAR